LAIEDGTLIYLNLSYLNLFFRLRAVVIINHRCRQSDRETYSSTQERTRRDVSVCDYRSNDRACARANGSAKRIVNSEPTRKRAGSSLLMVTLNYAETVAAHYAVSAILGGIYEYQRSNPDAYAVEYDISVPRLEALRDRLFAALAEGN
jgi:hypothetical protein